jgi:PTS system mannose-specific IID component
MQTLGFARALEPALMERYPDEGDRASALLRYMEFFNTNPFLASAVLGGAAHHEAAGEEELAGQTVKMLMGPFGGIGDSFFWGALRPLLLVIAIACVQAGQLWVVAAAVAAFALINLFSRAHLLNLGLSRGRRVVISVQRAGLVVWAQHLKVVAAALLGWVMVVAVATGPASGWGIGVLPLALGAVALASLVAWAARREVDPLWMVLGCTLITVGGSVLI